MGLFSKIGNGIRNAVSAVSRGVMKAAAVVAVGLFAASAFAEDAVATQPTVTLPTGVDVSTAITQAVTVLGGIVAVAIAGYCGFLLVRKAFRWIGKALG